MSVAQRRPSERGTKPSRPRSEGASALILGAHVSTAGGVDKAIGRAVSIGCTAMQLFVKNNMQWFAHAPFADAELRAFHEHTGRNRLNTIFGHSGYMINLCATNPEFLAKSRRALIEELLRADQLELPFLVLHPGAHMGAGIEAGLEKIVESIDFVLRSIPRVRARIALETTAGQGSCLGCEFEQLRHILREVDEPERICVCVDTAHLFAAGYDIRTEAGVIQLFAQFDKIIGRKQLAALHLNDSKAPLGSRVDRHEHIGKGQIGLEAFRYLMTAPRFQSVPKVLETPKGKEMLEDVENLATLRSLVGGAVSSKE